jgi:ADP-L-glycero-D-manno-heptose 6-epimerase
VETDVEKVMRQNYDFSVELAENCNTFGVNLQYASSASIYGNNQEFKEHSAADPKSPYAWSKYLFDRYVQKKKWDITIQGFRYFNVYGPGEDHKQDQASPYHKFRLQKQTQGFVELFEGSENFKRDFIHVDQVVDYHIKFLNVKQSGIWNIGTGKPKSFLEVALEITNNIQYIPMSDNIKKQYQYYTCADISKLQKTLQ